MSSREETIKILKDLIITGETVKELEFGNKLKVKVKFMDGTMATDRDLQLSRIPAEQRHAFVIPVELALQIKEMSGVPLEELFEQANYDSSESGVIPKVSYDGSPRDLSKDPLTDFEKRYAVVQSWKSVFQDFLRVRIEVWQKSFLAPMLEPVKKSDKAEHPLK